MADSGLVNHRPGTVAQHPRPGWSGRPVDGEIELIRRIAARVGTRGGLVTGIGDDAAVLADGTVLALDMLVEGVHVRRETHSWADIGHRALAVNLSDIAAMGAEPTAILVGLGIPDDVDASDIEALYDGMEALAEATGVAIAGGDVSTSPVLTLSVAIIGRMAPSTAPVLRSGARPGDVVVVTGPVGASVAGLMILEDPLVGTGVPERGDLIRAHLRPRPLLAEGRMLARAGASAMLDISDGLLIDAGRIADASGVRIAIDLDLVPRSPGVDRVAAAAGCEADILAATGGEDYQLLAALPPAAALTAAAAAETVIGQVSAGRPGVSAYRAGRDVTPARLGWEHGSAERP